MPPTNTSRAIVAAVVLGVVLFTGLALRAITHAAGQDQPLTVCSSPYTGARITFKDGGYLSPEAWIANLREGARNWFLNGEDDHHQAVILDARAAFALAARIEADHPIAIGGLRLLSAEKDRQHWAADAGHAEYYLDPTSGDIRWRWKQCGLLPYLTNSSGSIYIGGETR